MIYRIMESVNVKILDREFTFILKERITGNRYSIRAIEILPPVEDNEEDFSGQENVVSTREYWLDSFNTETEAKKVFNKTIENAKAWGVSSNISFFDGLNDESNIKLKLED